MASSITEDTVLKRCAIVLVGLAIGSPAACAADTASGSGALALAALVGIQSPAVTAAGRRGLARILDGDLGFPGHGKIRIEAADVTCRASDVDVSAHACTLKFGTASRTLKGRKAHELYATLIENGVASDGAAGSVFEAVSHLTCTIEFAALKQRGGGGAGCTYDAGPSS